MLSSKLLIALCDTDEEVNKFIHFNQRESLVQYMRDFCMGFNHVCGTPKSGSYLMCDIPLSGVVPDVLFEHKSKIKGKELTERFYGYLMEDIVAGLPK